MDFILQGQKRSGKSKNAVSFIRSYLEQGRRVMANMDVFTEGLRLPTSKRLPANFYDKLLIRIPDVPTANILDCMGHAYLRDNTGEFLHFGQSIREHYQSGDNSFYDEKYNGLIVIDESALTFDSRNWNSDNQKQLLEWIIHSGKYGWDICYIVHDLNTLDKRIREQYINLIYVHRNFRDYFPPETRGYFPEFHIVNCYNSVDKIGKKKGRVSRRFFVKRWAHQAYDTRQRFLPPEMDVFKNGVDSRTYYSVLPPRYAHFFVPALQQAQQQAQQPPQQATQAAIATTPQTPQLPAHLAKGKGAISVLSILFNFGFPVIALMFFVSMIFFRGGDEETPVVEPQPVTQQPSTPHQTKQVTTCSYDTLDVTPAVRRKFDADFLMQMFRYYDVEVQNLFDYGGHPSYTMLFKSPKDGRTVDITTDRELRNLGWMSVYWGGGIMLQNENIFFFTQNVERKDDRKTFGERLGDAVPVVNYLR